MNSLTAFLLLLLLSAVGSAAESTWQDAILLHANFDRSAEAQRAKGDPKIYTARTIARKVVKAGLDNDVVRWTPNDGRDGGALQFTKASKQLTFFKGGKNIPYRAESFEGTVSVWMRLSPSEDLPKGYVDPLQITDKKWNDASFFIDFDEHPQRDFRLGAFADYASWNPSKRDFDEIPTGERPMVVVQRPPFQRDRWTHVALVWSKLNLPPQASPSSKSPKGQASLYIDGKLQGSIHGRWQFTWKPENVVVMLGINYVGWIDDLMIFNRALTPSEITQLTK